MEKIGFKLIEKEKREFAGEISISRQNNLYRVLWGICPQMVSDLIQSDKLRH
ncbi:MAG: hypothetical protein ACUVTB_05890 [Candidatus Bathycorpusculaceae bacterium]